MKYLKYFESKTKGWDLNKVRKELYLDCDKQIEIVSKKLDNLNLLKNNLDEDLKVLGNQLRQRLKDAVQTLLTLKDESKLLSNNDVLDQSMQVRKPYLLPLHLLQAELMKRRRDYLAERQAENTPVDHALMVSIAGIAAGLRNTG